MECSFDNPAKKNSIRFRKIFAQGTRSIIIFSENYFSQIVPEYL